VRRRSVAFLHYVRVRNWKAFAEIQTVDGWMQETLGIQCVEVPLIEHKTGPDLPKLVHILRGIAFFVLHKLVLPFPHERCLLSHHFLFCV
jgi:hypothetical protein